MGYLPTFYSVHMRSTRCVFHSAATSAYKVCEFGRNTLLHHNDHDSKHPRFPHTAVVNLPPPGKLNEAFPQFFGKIIKSEICRFHFRFCMWLLSNRELTSARNKYADEMGEQGETRQDVQQERQPLINRQGHSATICAAGLRLRAMNRRWSFKCIHADCCFSWRLKTVSCERTNRIIKGSKSVLRHTSQTNATLVTSYRLLVDLLF